MAAATAILQTIVLLAAAAAQADYHVEVCSDLSTGASSNASGWTTSQSGSYVGASLCNGGGYIDVALFADVSHNYTDNGTAVFTAPANTTISSFDLWRWDQAAPVQPYGAPIDTITYDGLAVDACSQAYGCGGEGSTSSSSGSVVGASGLSAHQISVQAACGGGPGGVCPASSEPSEVRIYGGDIDLSQSTSPTVTSTSGPLIASGVHSGTQSVAFSASDDGSGVYSATLKIDGNTVESQIINTNGGRCQATRQNSDGSLVFNYAVPCPASASGSLSYDTAQLPDGSHTVQLIISDAAGNTTTAFDGSITTTNAPTAAGQPLIAGSAQVGQVLSGSDTTFTSPPSAGSTGVAHTFVRCDAQGANCQPIAGATGATYTVTSADAGSTIRYRDTATDNDGSTTADSVPTAVIPQPVDGGGSGSGGSGGSGGDGGSGGGGSGGSGASGAGGGGGTGGPGGSGGTSVTITLLPDGAVAGVELGTTAKWRVTLGVTPRTVHKHTLIRLSGRILTSPRPPAGKLVYLEARNVTTAWRRRGRRRRRVTVYGTWITFAAMRAKSDGSFSSTYRFRLGGIHRYQFRAVAPQEGGYRNATGNSPNVAVSET